MNNEKLINRFIDGDKTAINDLYTEYSPRLYRFAMAYLKSESEVLDIVQEVFVNVWVNRNKLKKDSNLDAYLFTVAKNTIVSVFRKKLSEKDYLEHLKNKTITNSIDTESQFNYNQLSDKLNDLVEQLPPQRKKIYQLSKEQGLANKTIAAELGISVKTVEDHLSKASKFIKKHLTEYGFLALLFIDLFINSK
ncbi:RNA polymerase sigma-70 factor, ECF subfamily [Draconibacterium orientale]|uniref:RNA polymerase sigma factor n=1 Tax=Draconibacterium orientale TaxID=1168034 RepID=X5DIE3_9BACT|nr:RNA polymerase sigma-70 factor [Draconibacterium orientale]AHW60272.1 RNA polymerase subunit sigma-24 [Draconibacterium orientale]SET67290.1 RNA polymerase sigma-70 factor, ECF subfamily [Draconibacterium orientale]